MTLDELAARVAAIESKLGMRSEPAQSPQSEPSTRPVSPRGMPPGYEPIPWIAIREGLDPNIWMLRPAASPGEPWGSRLTTIGSVWRTTFRADYSIPAWQNLERWVAAGSPLTDADGRVLDNRGFPVSGGDFSPVR